jgi:hypothetical protein
LAKGALSFGAFVAPTAVATALRRKTGKGQMKRPSGVRGDELGFRQATQRRGDPQGMSKGLTEAASKPRQKLMPGILKWVPSKDAHGQRGEASANRVESRLAQEEDVSAWQVDRMIRAAR